MMFLNKIYGVNNFIYFQTEFIYFQTEMPTLQALCFWGKLKYLRLDLYQV